MSSCCSIASFVMCRPVASLMMTCARRQTLCRLSSTSCTFSLEPLLTKKFMDLETSSPGAQKEKCTETGPGGENEYMIYGEMCRCLWGCQDILITCESDKRRYTLKWCGRLIQFNRPYLWYFIFDPSNSLCYYLIDPEATAVTIYTAIPYSPLFYKIKLRLDQTLLKIYNIIKAHQLWRSVPQQLYPFFYQYKCSEVRNFVCVFPLLYVFLLVF
jgi:hypothetical protein